MVARAGRGDLGDVPRIDQPGSVRAHEARIAQHARDAGERGPHQRLASVREAELDIIAARPGAEDVRPIDPDHALTFIDVERLRRRSEEHTSELQSLMRISYADFS